MKIKRYWLIKVYDSTDILFESKVPFGQITSNGMKELLRVLTAKYALTEKEIIGCYTKRRTKIHTDLLEVRCDTRITGKYILSCGNNPYSIATIGDEA